MGFDTIFTKESYFLGRL